MNFEKLSSPEFFGPGLWLSIHMIALHADDLNAKKAFVRYIYILSENIKCSKCKVHMTKYIAQIPPESYWGLNPVVEGNMKCSGMFYWSWEFHNAVNKRLRKPQLTLPEAFKLIKDPIPCSSDCDDHGEKGIELNDVINSYLKKEIQAKPF